MRTLRKYGGFMLATGLLAVAGIASAAYVLINSRAPVPFQDTYDVKAAFSAADGVVPGLGQPVQVAGVKVGTVTQTDHKGGLAVVTMTVDRDELPRVHRDAKAVLVPITPLKDMQINLEPGTSRAPALDDGGTIGVADTAPPVPLSDLLSTLDGDTREFLSSLIASTGAGLDGRGADMRKALRALGPTATQLKEITGELASRRIALSRLVHNVSAVTRAASRDERLASLVQAGNRTLEAVARQDVPLRAALQKLPPTLQTARATLRETADFADEVRPAVTDLTPSVRRLPGVLAEGQRFSNKTRVALHDTVRPLVREIRPLLRDAGPAITRLKGIVPRLSQSAQVLNYILNEYGYNPPGSDEGLRLWTSWWAGAGNSVFASQDAHGSLGRSGVLFACTDFDAAAGLGQLMKLVTGSAVVCP